MRDAFFHVVLQTSLGLMALSSLGLLWLVITIMWERVRFAERWSDIIRVPVRVFTVVIVSYIIGWGLEKFFVFVF